MNDTLPSSPIVEPGWDTLWLRARDFAAHAIIMSLADRASITPLRLRGKVNPYANNAPLYAITVPRDFDDYQWGGVNRGDFMADYWEETVFGLSEGNTAIRDFFPFLNLGTDGMFHTDSIADRDSSAVGRGIRGDGLTNWEEYRGFWTIGDHNTFPYTQPIFERMDPRHKTVFKAVSPRIANREPDLYAVFPAWDSLLNTPNFSTADFNEYLDIRYVDLPLNEDFRTWLRTGRTVNQHREGASFLYYGYYHPTPVPARYTQDAVTFWEADIIDQNFMDRRGRELDANTWPYDINIPFGFPNGINRVEVNVRGIANYGNSPYYNGGGEIWAGGDYQLLMKYLLTHEFGHTIGIEHNIGQKTIMYLDTLNNRGVPWDPATGRLFNIPGWNNDFNSNDKDQSTVKSETQP